MRGVLTDIVREKFSDYARKNLGFFQGFAWKKRFSFGDQPLWNVYGRLSHETS